VVSAVLLISGHAGAVHFWVGLDWLRPDRVGNTVTEMLIAIYVFGA